ncbi:MAG: tetratricopeptide repeat protein [Taibaiella sp.]|jgi:tetratricopeptide (TPR) repeat protein
MLHEINCSLSLNQRSKDEVIAALSVAIQNYLIEEQNMAFLEPKNVNFEEIITKLATLTGEIKVKIENTPYDSTLIPSIRELIKNHKNITISHVPESWRITLQVAINDNIKSILSTQVENIKAESSRTLEDAINQKISFELTKEDQEFLDSCRYEYFSHLAKEYLKEKEKIELTGFFSHSAYDICQKYPAVNKSWNMRALESRTILLSVYGEYIEAAKTMIATAKHHENMHQEEESRDLHIKASHIIIKAGKKFVEDNQRESAIKLYEAAELLYQNSLTNNKDLAHVLIIEKLASLRFNMEQYEDAGTLYLKALATYKIKYVTNSSLYAMILSNLGSVYIKLEKYKEAKESLTESLEVYRKIADNKPLDVAFIQHSLAGVLLHLEEYGQAKMYANAALEIRTNKLTPNNPLTVITQELLTLINNRIQMQNCTPQYFIANLWKRHLDQQKDFTGIIITDVTRSESYDNKEMSPNKKRKL